ncbi:Ubiquitin thioesterase otubain-like [Hibiscus syriacus]|uniref:Ubiquitin thioesterase n=1 Tax=Hibiscus syriacus TaxID=106335 RepID=A0A6A3CSV5_HIBSY|nr:OVARIAN TUMOR DOMAIN-containing deubiquitinating enzyme 1-like [Hibiscus syriacus]XP_039035584.1 OVARIAN TUMOR DOMAIN-containing deubiquitinating enzyme 1-like [Hibiscus syriacus]XP_039035589.1 OVARIAN TUMOR DOMAIN-containing deubiquitinating enzyme 1-like [Hibiscus syriacus]XP_039035596.1 OVARIAN TUMOR DOMAIN-containing deubiquitinating enzyme 1-like [Hibiscus syriacus]XP_039035600.1 OVARIAN TUMOR DOMAIN-containing deubiquitinating enzyme 1-like [Hibiscus syriacus]XP_039035603.1 OVARIAN TU
MQNQEGVVAAGEKESAVSIPISETESAVSIPISEGDDWANFADDDIMQQQSTIHDEEAKKVPFVGDKEPLSMLAAEYESGSPILLEKIKVLEQQYAAIRRTRGDGNCFFRSFMFSYLEHILESQDRAEVDCIKCNVEECRKTLQSLGYAELTFEDFFALFLEQLDCVLQGNEDSISQDELIQRSRDQSISDYVVMFFRFVTSGEIQKRSEFFEPFILGLTNATVEQFCKSSVEPMGEESDHVHITALSDSLGVPIRVVYLDRSSCDVGGVSVNHHDFLPTSGDKSNATSGSSIPMKPSITLLYRPGHYDILYPK